MAKVIVKIPKDKKKVRIIRDSELIRSQYAKGLDVQKPADPIDISGDTFLKEPLDLPHELYQKGRDEDAANKPVSDRKCKPAVFSQRFKISNSNQPISISLDKVKEESITISHAKEEIQNAYNKGFIDGQDASRAIYNTELKDKIGWIKRIDSVIDKMDKQFNAELFKFEELIVDAAVMIAEKLLENELEANPEFIIKQVKKAIRQLDDEKIFTIKVNPSDLEILKDVKADLVHDPEMIRRAKLIPDRKLTRGDVLLETEAGKIDARIKTQLDRIERALKATIVSSASDIFKSKDRNEASDED